VFQPRRTNHRDLSYTGTLALEKGRVQREEPRVNQGLACTQNKTTRADAFSPDLPLRKPTSEHDVVTINPERDVSRYEPAEGEVIVET
jgi:hypothetical protein